MNTVMNTATSGNSIAFWATLTHCCGSAARGPARALWLVVIATFCPQSLADEVSVRSDAELRAALREVKAGSVIKVAAGTYSGGWTVRDVERLTIEGTTPENPPVFSGGSVAWHFSRCNGLRMRHLRITGQTGNGVNLDDGGVLDQPMVDATIEQLHISNIGPKGNCDGLKASGLDRLTVHECNFEGWAGQATDLVGCHQVTIRKCTYTGKEGFRGTAGVQIKGGSERVIVEECRFVNAGERPINVGGSTGAAYFRPPGAKYESRRVIVRSNTIEGGLCAVAFVGTEDSEFSGNTIRFPEKWIFRILQENTSPGFVPCRNVKIVDNDIRFRGSSVQVECNIGSGTEPKTFRFRGNQWLAVDQPENFRPKLPTEEE